MSGNLQKILSSLILLLTVLIVVAVAVFFYTPARIHVLALLGLTSGCPAGEIEAHYVDLQEERQAEMNLMSVIRPVTTDAAGYHLWDTPKGRFWTPPRTYPLDLPGMILQHERKIYGEGEQAVRSGDIVLDGGANVGVFTRYSLDAGAKLVVAIEISPQSLECLRRNFAPEIKSGRVIVYPKGVWDHEDKLQLHLMPEGSLGDSVAIKNKESYDGPVVPLTTIDNLVAELKLERVDFIKLDVEGAEEKALIGASRTLARFHPRIAVSTENSPDQPVRIPPVVKKAWNGYKMECGHCVDAKFSISPHVLYFR